MALYRKRMLAIDVPPTLGVLWGDEVAGVRKILKTAKTVGAIQSRFDKDPMGAQGNPSENLHERKKLKDGDWLLKTHHTMTEREYLELRDGTATLVNNVLTLNNAELIEE